MDTYLYRWSLRPREGVRLELEVTAARASDARRAIERLLREDDPARWVLESVSRTKRSVTQPVAPPAAPVVEVKAASVSWRIRDAIPAALGEAQACDR